MEKPIQAMRFGLFGREENSLILIHGPTGALSIRILKRLFDFEAVHQRIGNSLDQQETPLQVPKKTKLYVEQTQRECEQGALMHSVFQRDLCKLRLETARAYVKTLTEPSMVKPNSIYTALILPSFLSPNTNLYVE